MSVTPFADSTLERALLGLIVSGKPDEHGAIAAKDVLPLLDPGDFQAVGNAKICEAAKAAMVGGGLGVVAVIAALKDMNALNLAGGEEYIQDLPFYGLSIGDPVPLVATLKELARARRFVEAANAVLRTATPGVSAGRFIEHARAAVDRAIADSHVVAEYESAGEGFAAVYDACSKHEPPRAWSTGLLMLDQLLGGGLYAGTLTVIAARPGTGKTGLATQIAYDSAAIHNEPSLMFNLEMPPLQIWQRKMAAAAHVPHAAIRRHETIDATHGVAMAEAAERARKVPFYIHRRGRGDRKPTPETMIAMARAFKQRYGGLAVMVLDYIQIATPPGDGPKHERIAEVTMALKDAAIELNCAVIALSQFNRGAANERPDISQLAQSGAIESDADQVLMLYKPDQASNEVTCIIGKQRDGVSGDLPMRFINTEVRFEEALP